MSPLVQWLLVVLGLLGAAGTWFRAVVAFREHLAAERERRRAALIAGRQW